MATALEQLRYIDEQLATAVLPQDQAELVRVHRLTGLQLRTERMQGSFLKTFRASSEGSLGDEGIYRIKQAILA